ncbi:arabinose 5-phosphate isomerase [Sodiomyces alkalinus F11]|uniref:Arabinose 5-phosphate isomerase n=1 Tax=Sodiomyces alkalinus (strain CBS 110278 / VKM F-3762 / F11) TaxID=1314773 RepID=A0A3N2Q3Q7_SODAK|nr:arabinose 5-phosphate isomerase [Sodiomyces alkalinus F11]ROT41404.1 arabinose 5-phosphate isomerase [Sodiomyces alkalinus F11]
MGDHRCGEHRPVQTSAVVVLGASRKNTAPPPSPPSPPGDIGDPVASLCLDALDNDLAKEEALKTASRLRMAVHVLDTEAAALRSVTRLYETDPIARDGFHRTVESIARHKDGRGKLVMTGVGKSGHIAKKLAATFNSLSLPTVFLNPTDALHGDIGMVGPDDTLLFITFSGKTPELLGLLPHLNRSSTLVLLTGHSRPRTCDFVKLRPDTILLPAPVHEKETTSFGVAAPTTSTTVALAVGDALAIATAQELHSSVASVFTQNHPGGAIGAAFRQDLEETLRDVAIQWEEIPDVLGPESLAADVLREGFDSATKWVRAGNEVASPSRIRRLCRAGAGENLQKRIGDVEGLMVPRHEMLSICAGTSIRRAVEFVRNARGAAADEEERMICGPESILAVLDRGTIVGVLEVGDLLDRPEGL